MFLKAGTSGNLVLAPALPASLVTGCMDFTDKVQCLKDDYSPDALGKNPLFVQISYFQNGNLVGCCVKSIRSPRYTRVILWDPSCTCRVGFTHELHWEPPQPSVLQPILKKHHSKALRLPVNGRLKFMMTGQLVNMDLLFYFTVCLC